jgi:putative restriction endonuclease
LLLLYALGQFQRNGDTPILYSQAEEQLGQLLREFGPPRPTSTACPFHHLTSDGVWAVRTASGDGSPGASPKALRSQQAAGRLTKDLAGHCAVTRCCWPSWRRFCSTLTSSHLCTMTSAPPLAWT